MTDTHTTGIELVWMDSYPIWQWKCSCGNGGYHMLAGQDWADDMARKHLEQVRLWQR